MKLRKYVYYREINLSLYGFFSFQSRVLVLCFRFWTSSAKRECSDVNVFLKVEVTSRKFNSYFEYYKIDSTLGIKLEEINLNVCREHKIEDESYSHISNRYSNYFNWREFERTMIWLKLIVLQTFRFTRVMYFHAQTIH